jgi:hypothetical protein
MGVDAVPSNCYIVLIPNDFMPSDKQKTKPKLARRLISLFLGLSWLEILPDLLKSAQYFWERLTNSEMYEVLDYESTLELLDKDGHRAYFSKREEVRYLQNSIIAYQDQAWGDGDGSFPLPIRSTAS